MLSKIGIASFVLALAFVIAGVTGWVLNIIELANIVGGDITGMFVLRIIGIVIVPLGAVLGYL